MIKDDIEIERELYIRISTYIGNISVDDLLDLIYDEYQGSE